MNQYSKWRAAAGALALVAATAATGCGGNADNAATTKADWTKKHGAAVAAVSGDVDAALDGIQKGDRTGIIATCNETDDDLATARKGLPVPDPATDTALRAALDAVAAAVPDCLQGARVGSEAAVTEKARDEFKQARPKMDEAQKALDAWT